MKAKRKLTGAKDALTELKDIKAVRRYFEERENRVMLDLFNVGINLGLRISDLQQLEYANVDYKGKYYRLKEKKTGKFNKVYLNSEVLSIIRKRRTDYPHDKYIFTNHYYDGTPKEHKNPLNLHYASIQFKNCGRWLGLNISTHTMRKTFGASLYRQGVDLVLISKMLNHSSPALTYIYIGLQQEDIKQAYENIQFK
jgi:integrase